MDAHPRSVGGFDIARLDHEVGTPTKLLYFREEVGQLWDVLDNLILKPAQVAGLNVEGSPGVGKSSLARRARSIPDPRRQRPGGRAIGKSDSEDLGSG